MALKNVNMTASWVVLLCMAWLQPNHFSPWVSFHSEFLAFLAFVTLFAIAFIKRDSVRFIEIPSAALAMLLLLGMTLVQAAMGITNYGGDTVVFFLYIFAMIFAVIVGRLWGGENRIYQLAWGLLFAGVVSVIVATLQSMHSTEQFTLVNPMPNWRRPGANLAQPNHLGTLLLWSIASSMYLLASKKISKQSACLLGAVLLVGIAMTESRTALLGVFAVSVWAGLHYFQGLATRRLAMTLGFAGVGTLLFALWPIFATGFQEAGPSMGNASVNTQAGERLVVWPQLYAAIADRPWLGWGVRGVSVAHNAVLDRFADGAPFTYAHNVILDLAIGFGIPMTLLLVGMAAVWSARRMAHIRNITDWYAFALLIPFGLHSMLEFPFAYAYFLLPACFVMGMLDVKRVNTVVVRLPPRFAMAVFAAWAVVGAVVVRDYVLAEEDFRVARFEALKIGRPPASYVRPHLLLLNQLDAMNVAIRVVPTPEMTASDIEALRKAALRYPWTAIQNRYALALALNGNLPEAQRQLKVMRAMHGEKMYATILGQWRALADDKYPQLQRVVSP